MPTQRGPALKRARTSQVEAQPQGPARPRAGTTGKAGAAATAGVATKSRPKPVAARADADSRAEGTRTPAANAHHAPGARVVGAGSSSPSVSSGFSGPATHGLAHGICAQLQQLIYSGDVPPGERLNEAALALRMGTSRGPIREAIRMLAGSGLVVAVRNRGVFVREISVREMLEIYELRALLLGFAAQQAAEHLSPADRDAFTRLLDGMDAACDAGDGQQYYTLNLRFHALLMAQCRNLRAQQAYEDHVKELHLYRRRYFDATVHMRRSNAEHRRIFEAVAAGAAERANRLAQAHVLQGRQRLLGTLDVPAMAAARGPAGAALASDQTRATAAAAAAAAAAATVAAVEAAPPRPSRASAPPQPPPTVPRAPSALPAPAAPSAPAAPAAPRTRASRPAPPARRSSLAR